MLPCSRTECSILVVFWCFTPAVWRICHEDTYDDVRSRRVTRGARGRPTTW